MKLFELNRTNWDVEITPEAVLLQPFQKLIKRDKTRNKEVATKELALIYHYCDIRSDFLGIEEESKMNQIIESLHFPKNYKVDKDVLAAMEFYKKFKTPVETLYEGAVIASQAIDSYLRNTGDLLAERTEKGAVVTPLSVVTASLRNLSTIMRELKSAYKEVVKEQRDTTGKMKGSKEMNMFEDGV